MKKEKGFYGYLAGTMAAILLQPLENIKIALMIPPSNLKLESNFISNITTASKYIHDDSSIKGFYKGLLPNVIKTGFSSAIFFSSLRGI